MMAEHPCELPQQRPQADDVVGQNGFTQFEQTAKEAGQPAGGSFTTTLLNALKFSNYVTLPREQPVQLVAQVAKGHKTMVLCFSDEADCTIVLIIDSRQTVRLDAEGRTRIKFITYSRCIDGVKSEPSRCSGTIELKFQNRHTQPLVSSDIK